MSKIFFPFTFIYHFWPNIRLLNVLIFFFFLWTFIGRRQTIFLQRCYIRHVSGGIPLHEKIFLQSFVFKWNLHTGNNLRKNGTHWRHNYCQLIFVVWLGNGKFMVFLVIKPTLAWKKPASLQKSPRALEPFGLGLYRAYGLCSACPAMSRARPSGLGPWPVPGL